MSEDIQKKDQKTLTRYGKVIYESNPSIEGAFPVKIKSKLIKQASAAYMIAPDTGEVISKGVFGFIEEHEVDEAQFVKIYLDGIRKYGELTKSGAIVFELVYTEMSGKKGKDKDTVSLNHYIALRWRTDLNKRTYERGLNELLEKGFLFRSIFADTYFVNIRFMFNGNRQTVIKSYRIKGTKSFIEGQQDLFGTLQSPENETTP